MTNRFELPYCMSKVQVDEWRVALNLCSQWFTAEVLILVISLSKSAIFSAQRLLQPVSSPFTHNSLSPLSVLCVVFGTHNFFLQPGYPSRFEVEINVCPMALQPWDCRPVQRRLAASLPDGFTTTELSSSSTSSR